MDFFPQLPFLTGSRIVTETIPILTVSMLLYVDYMFRDHISKWLVWILLTLSGIYILITAFARPMIYTTLFNWYLFVPLIVCGAGLYVAIIGIRERSGEAVLYLAGSLFIVAGAVNDILVFRQAMDTGYRLGVGLAAFAVIQSFIMAIQYSRFTNERKRLYDKLHETDLAFMQAQIKPHFIYNALSAISYTVGKDPNKAKELILDFSDYLRGCFDFSNTSGLTTLAKEMDIVKAYLSIEKERFHERLNVEYDIRESPHVLIPMLSIQPIVENAVRHGLMSKTEGGTVTIMAWNEKGDTRIRVEDDGVGISKDRIRDLFAENTSSTGLRNINGRLKLKFGTELKITNRSDKQGTCVEFIVPGKPKFISGLQD
jgi:signal transduction histidine kinase